MSIQFTKEQLQELGLADHTAAEREAYYIKVGKCVFDAALLRLLGQLNEEQIYALNHAIDSLDSFDAVVEYLQQTYPGFIDFVEQEQNVFIDHFMAETEVKE